MPRSRPESVSNAVPGELARCVRLRADVGAAVALALLAAPLALALVHGPTASAATFGPVSARFLAEAIVRNGAFTPEECPPSDVAEHSAPGCASIPAPLETAQRWLDLIEEAVFLETTRVGGWEHERSLAYVVWRLEPTGQRYLLVLAPHPHTETTILYVSELAGEAAAAAD